MGRLVGTEYAADKGTGGTPNMNEVEGNTGGFAALRAIS